MMAKQADLKTVVELFAIGAGVYLVYTLVQGLKQAAKTPTDVYNQTSELFDTTPDPGALTFASWYDPTQRIVFFYYLTFPDGNQHLVWASSVQSDGTFVYSDNNLYRIGNDKSGGLRAYAYSYPDFGLANPTSWG
jgi:hypothetical protein